MVVTKAGKRTFGLDRFFSSRYGRPVKGLCFFSLSRGVKRRTSYPLGCWQVVRASKEKALATAQPKQATDKPSLTRQQGRPKGSMNRDKVNVVLSAHLQFMQGLLRQLLGLVRRLIQVDYLVLDGADGYNEVMQLARELKLSLISKLKRNAALSLPYEGEQKARGAKRKYGQKLDYQHLPGKYLQSSTASAGVQTDSYQKALHKEFGQPLNLVIIAKTKLASGERAHVLLFTDLSLACQQLIDYYSLRFQLEFNFRDAKQFWGLEDFRHLKERSIHNAANLSLFMVNLAKVLLGQLEPRQTKSSVLDLKAHFRAEKYALETLKLLPQKPDAFLIRHILASPGLALFALPNWRRY